MGYRGPISSTPSCVTIGQNNPVADFVIKPPVTVSVAAYDYHDYAALANPLSYEPYGQTLFQGDTIVLITESIVPGYGFYRWQWWVIDPFTGEIGPVQYGENFVTSIPVSAAGNIKAEAIFGRLA